MKNTFKIFFLTLLLTIVGCTDESKDPLPQLERGAFVRFTDEVPASAYSDPMNIDFTEEIYSPDNNVIEYTLSLKANLGGTAYIVEDFFTATTVPTAFSFNSQSLADALGVDVSDINFGDTFDFIATVTRTDGTLFYGLVPDFDDDNLTVAIGNTESNLLSIPAYKSAMAFNFIIACDFVQADMIGTYTIDSTGFFMFGDDQFEVIAGSTASEIILVSPFDSSGNYNITIDVSPFGLATFEEQRAFEAFEVCDSCGAFGAVTIRSSSSTSLALSCIGLLELKYLNALLNPDGSDSGFVFTGGERIFTAQKN